MQPGWCQPVRQEFMENECEALPGVAYPGVRDNRSTLNTKTRYDMMNLSNANDIQAQSRNRPNEPQQNCRQSQLRNEQILDLTSLHWSVRLAQQH